MSRASSVDLKAIVTAAIEDRRDLDLRGAHARTISWAIETGLGAWLHRLAAFGSAGVHGNALHAQDLAARVESGARLDALEEILSAAGAACDEIVVLKGASLCRRVYPEPHLRMMGDIDLLVPPRLRRLLESRLRGLGYEQRSRLSAEYYLAHHHSMPFVHPRHPLTIEVHTGLFRPGTALAAMGLFDPPRFHARRVPQPFRAHPAHRLPDDAELAYLIVHWLYERKCFGTAVIPVLDLALLLARLRADFDWDGFLAAVAGTPAGAYVRVGLRFLGEHLGVALPGAVRSRLRSLSSRPGALVDRRLHRWLDRHALRGEPFGRLMGANNVNIAWDALLAPRPAWVNLGSLPWRLLFPPEHPLRYDLGFQRHRLTSMVARMLGRRAQRE